MTLVNEIFSYRQSGIETRMLENHTDSPADLRTPVPEITTEYLNIAR
jgi:hypothetical protein